MIKIDCKMKGKKERKVDSPDLRRHYFRLIPTIRDPSFKISRKTRRSMQHTPNHRTRVILPPIHSNFFHRSPTSEHPPHARKCGETSTAGDHRSTCQLLPAWTVGRLTLGCDATLVLGVENELELTLAVVGPVLFMGAPPDDVGRADIDTGGTVSKIGSAMSSKGLLLSSRSLTPVFELTGSGLLVVCADGWLWLAPSLC